MEPLPRPETPELATQLSTWPITFSVSANRGQWQSAREHSLAATKVLGFTPLALHLPAQDRLTLVDENHEMRWTEYAFSMLLFSGVSMLVLYLMQRVQQILPLNPQKFAGVVPDLAFNTAASFTTRTWRSRSRSAPTS